MPTEVMRLAAGCGTSFSSAPARAATCTPKNSGIGIKVHIIKGYGDIAVAEHTIALMWAAARGIAAMDGGMRRGEWIRTEGTQLTGKTLGLVGFGGIAGEVARIAAGSGMRVLAWNRSPKTRARRDASSISIRCWRKATCCRCTCCCTTRRAGSSAPSGLAQLRPGVILVNTARGALSWMKRR